MFSASEMEQLRLAVQRLIVDNEQKVSNSVIFIFSHILSALFDLFFVQKIKEIISFDSLKQIKVIVRY